MGGCPEEMDLPKLWLALIWLCSLASSPSKYE
jgi:hypothetical protein